MSKSNISKKYDYNEKLTQKILNYFFINPQENLYVNELSRKLQLDKRNLVKKLKELETEGILNSKTRGTLKFYSIKLFRSKLLHFLQLMLQQLFS